MAEQKVWVSFSKFEREEPDTAKEIYKRLPRQMLVTNSLEMGLHSEAKTTGVRRRYIQVNHANLTKMMVFDVDNPISVYDWKYLDVPLPNILVINPKNNHAHLIYLLSEQNYVCRSTNGRLKDIIQYETIYAQLCQKLNADSRYVQKIMKNPFFNGWNTVVLHQDTYTFEDFFRYVDKSTVTDKTGGSRRSEESYLREQEGRNCTIFEKTRYFAYASLKNFNNGKTTDDAQAFYEAVAHYAATLNDVFDTPLGPREMAATVKSIVNWTLIHMGTATEKQEFEKKDIWGNKSRINSQKTRSSTKKENINKAGTLRAKGNTIEQIAKELERSIRMVEYYLKEYKKYISHHPETKNKLNKIKELLKQWIYMQFVISDMVAVEQGLLYLNLLNALLQTDTG